MGAEAEYSRDRFRRREVEQRLTSELHAATEKARLARDDPEQFQRAWDVQLIALERFRKFVAHGVIPPDLELLATSAG